MHPALAAPVSILRSLLNTGTNVTCPVCNRSFRRFIPGGGINRRPDARCPACDALERHRLFGLFLRRTTNLLTRNQVLLHFAPERCFRQLFKNSANGEYVTADLQSPLAEVHTDITALVFPDRRFDALICLHVLEHIADDAAALKELFRVLKPGGTAYILTPVEQSLEKTIEDREGSTAEERTERFDAPDHLRKYGRDFVQRIGSAGFRVEAIDFYKELKPEERKKYGLIPGEFIYRCTRPA
ncbi:MAG: class I SAM-dependent methyltransferase [Chitinispirillaceae bacterium]|nr:class I SAM-dependent methyltransferase [Chitinispirillaceae bacterium]